MIGSGKTAIGERLAARLGRPFLDLDCEMDRELGRSFHYLVREQGWLAFRELEYALCKRFAAMRGIVCGRGGSVATVERGVRAAGYRPPRSGRRHPESVRGAGRHASTPAPP
jgi:shikimate kinase